MGVARRCGACGAPHATDANEGDRCAECQRPLTLAPRPVSRGPAGWCAAHPDSPVTGVCASCGRFTCTECEVSIAGLRYCAACRQRHRRAFTAPVAWEERAALGRFRAWYRTTSQVTGQPGRFFEQLEPTTRLGGALVFALVGAVLHQSGHGVMSIIGSVGSLVVAVVGALSSQDPSLFLAQAGYHAVKLLVLVASPFLLLLLYLVVASLQHLTLRLVDAGAENGIEATLKVACYAFALGWLGILPFLGQAVFPIWWTVVMVIGTARIHHRSTTRTAVVILPTALLFLAPVAACIAAVVLGALAA